ncbi:MAG: TIGR03773 family transporter-associated surface protein [Arcanobacterium sp.]|nr:TIGR03773 family transporter-associated surface protein [Arcanobacterium sp.]
MPTENNPLRLETAPTATAPEAGSYVIAKPGHFDLAFSAATKTRSSTNLNAALIDSSEPGKDIARASHTVVIPVPDSTISELQTTGNHAALAALGAAGTKVWSLPDVQNPDLVWLGWNTEQMPSERLGKNSRIGITKHYGPGEVAQWTAGGIYPDEMLLTTTDPGRTLNMPVATHMHMVTTFTQPGLHEVEHSFVDELGEQVSYTTYFAVGDKTIAELQKAAKNAGEITTGKTGVEGEAEEKENSAAQSPENNAAENTGAGTEVAETQCIPTTIRREATAEEARDLQNSNSANSQNIATTTLNFNVGSGGGISSGHFDLGPGIENGKVTAKLKDDRSQPAQWIDPASVSFALGEASAITAPELLNFVATPGSKVWMISSVQQQNVPWIGMNSQRPEIVNGTTGTVKFTLKSVAGPGKIAVFESGALGSGIGRKLFTSPGSSFTLPKNTHAHYNWVFTQPGTYRVTIAIEVEQTSTAAAVSSAEAKTDVELGPNGRPMISVVVGKTATGEDCELALTGNSNISTLITLLITVFSVGIVLSVTPRFKKYLKTLRS